MKTRVASHSEPGAQANGHRLRRAPSSSPHTLNRQRGIALVFVLLMLAIATGLAVVTARMTLMGDKASRNDRDRQIAFQAAELALNDAELDIMDPEINFAFDKGRNNDTDVSKSRGCTFGNPNAGLSAGAGCSATSAARGVCGLDPSQPTKALHEYVDWNETGTARAYVNFGEYTGRSGDLVVGQGVTPAKKPKYIIFQTTGTNVMAGDAMVPISYSYRIYALGYGANENTQVMLEAEIYKPKLDKFCSR